MPNPTQIIPPRVPLIDERTGNISREWYRFFLHLFDVTGGGSGSVTIPDLQAAPLFQKQVEYPDTTPPSRHVTVEVDTTPMPNIGGLWTALNAVQSSVPTSYAPASTAPVTKTADFTVASTDQWLINNKSGSTCTVTLPSASSISGRVLSFQNYQAQQLVSASSNVIPAAGGAAGTAILAATTGKWATLVSDGTNWVITQCN
jgi:hypothetical protein